MDQVTEALHLLFHSTDPRQRSSADDWLKQWQLSAGAWPTCDKILSASSPGLEVAYLAAQTLKRKIQYDFAELPEAEHFPLRDSILQHMCRYDEGSAPIITQLALSIAGISLHLTHSWEYPLQTISEILKNKVPTLLECLKVLAEETFNEHIMVENSKRIHHQKKLSGSKESVMLLLLEVRGTLGNTNSVTRSRVLDCWCSWLRVVDFAVEVVVDCALLSDCFEIVESGNTDSESASDALMDLLSLASLDEISTTALEILLTKFFDRIPSLQARFEQGMKDIEQNEQSLHQIANVLTSLGIFAMQIIIDRVESSTECQQLVYTLFVVAATPYSKGTHRDIATTSFSFWKRVCRSLSTGGSDKKVLNTFTHLLLRLVDVCVKQMTFPTAADVTSSNSDFAYFRDAVEGLLEDILVFISPADMGMRIFQGLSDANQATPLVIESHLTALSLVIRQGIQKCRLDNPLVNSPQMESLFTSFHDVLKPEKPQDVATAALRVSALRVIGNLVYLNKNNTQRIAQVLKLAAEQLMANQLFDSEELKTEEGAVVERIRRHAARVILRLCESNTISMRDALDDLVKVCEALDQSMSEEPYDYLVESVATILAKHPDDQKFMSAFSALTKPWLAFVDNHLSNPTPKPPNMVITILDRFACLLRHFVYSEDARGLVLATFVQHRLWPIVKVLLGLHEKHERCTEKCCRVMKHAMRAISPNFKPLIPEFDIVIRTGFLKNNQSSFLYAAEYLATEFYNDGDVLPRLKDLFCMLSDCALKVIAEAVKVAESRTTAQHDGLAEHCALIEDCFGMIGRYCSFAPLIVATSPTLPMALEQAIPCLGIEQREANNSLSRFFSRLYDLSMPKDDYRSKKWDQVVEEGEEVSSSKLEKDNRAADVNTAVPLIRPLLLQFSPVFLVHLFQKFCAMMPNHVYNNVVDEILMVWKAFPDEFPMWIELVFNENKFGGLSEVMLKELKTRLLFGEDPARAALNELSRRCEEIAMRQRS